MVKNNKIKILLMVMLKMIMILLISYHEKHQFASHSIYLLVHGGHLVRLAADVVMVDRGCRPYLGNARINGVRDLGSLDVLSKSRITFSSDLCQTPNRLLCPLSCFHVFFLFVGRELDLGLWLIFLCCLILYLQSFASLDP